MKNQAKNIAIYHEFPDRKRIDSVEPVAEEKIDDNEFTYEQPENREEKAKYLFNKGVLLEQQNRHYEAIKFYRIALQLDADIEYKACCNDMEPKNSHEAVLEKEVASEINENKPFDTDESKESSLYDQFRQETLTENNFCSKKFPQSSKHFSELPNEVVMLILKWIVSDQLDIRSVEKFSLVCKGFYVFGRDPEVWRLACARVWGPKNLPINKYENWRHMFLTRPHLNFDGVYISKTSYVRAGEPGLDGFYRPWHLVEYYRYFRFYPDGCVIFLTVCDEPRNTVAKLKIPAVSGDQNILKGTWTLTDAKILIKLAKKIMKKTTSKYSRKHGDNDKNVDQEQAFTIELEVSSEKRRLNNQLKWLHYEIDTFYKASNEKSHTKLDLNKVDFPIFYFSHVRSYVKLSENPLR